MPFKFALLLAACPLLMFADGVSISSSCSLTNSNVSVSPPVVNTVSQVNPAGGCSVSLPDPLSGAGNAHAAATVLLDLPVAGQPSLPVGAGIKGDIGIFPGGLSEPISHNGTVQLSVSIDYLLSTSGPVRSGFMSLSFITGLNAGSDRPDTVTSNVSIGSFIPSFQLSDPGNVGTAPRIPFTLGQNFLFQ